jgi:hypothetical protein
MFKQCCIISIILILTYFCYYQKENFSTKQSDMKICNSCYIKNRHSCSFCKNCVYCFDNSICTPGNINGPFKQECEKWEYKFPWKNI